MMRRLLFDITMLLAFLICAPQLFAQTRSSDSSEERTSGFLDTAGSLGHRAVDITTSALDKLGDKIADTAKPATAKAAAKTRSAWERGKDWVGDKVQGVRAWWHSTDPDKPATSPADAR